MSTIWNGVTATPSIVVSREPSGLPSDEDPPETDAAQPGASTEAAVSSLRLVIASRYDSVSGSLLRSAYTGSKA